jgi:hypothetical protein
VYVGARRDNGFAHTSDHAGDRPWRWRPVSLRV